MIQPTSTGPAGLLSDEPPVVSSKEMAAAALREGSFRGLYSLSGCPALSIPCGFTSEGEGGLPLALQIAGPHLGEAAIFRAATPTSRPRRGTSDFRRRCSATDLFIRSDTVMNLTNGLIVRFAIAVMVLAWFAVASSLACASVQRRRRQRQVKQARILQLPQRCQREGRVIPGYPTGMSCSASRRLSPDPQVTWATLCAWAFRRHFTR